VVAGLGGRAITKASLHKLLQDAIADKLELLTFLDLDWDIVNRVLDREKKQRRSGPMAEGILRDIGTVASRLAEGAPNGTNHRQVLPDWHLYRGQPPARSRTSAACRPTRSATTRSTPATAPARAAARHSARVTPSTRPCRPPTAS
jgi:hypothetical protein